MTRENAPVKAHVYKLGVSRKTRMFAKFKTKEIFRREENWVVWLIIFLRNDRER